MNVSTSRCARSFSVAVTFLQKSHELFAVAVDLVEFVVGELAPLRTDLALQLKPFAFQNIWRS